MKGPLFQLGAARQCKKNMIADLISVRTNTIGHFEKRSPKSSGSFMRAGADERRCNRGSFNAATNAAGES